MNHSDQEDIPIEKPQKKRQTEQNKMYLDGQKQILTLYEQGQGASLAVPDIQGEEAL